MRRFIVIASFIFTVFSTAWPETDALLNRLAPAGQLNDFANLFKADQKENCQRLLTEIKNRTSAELAIVTLPTLEGAEINDFANRLFQKWGIGARKQDNGVLILVAIQEKKARIEVGYGLESIIPDAKAGRILDEVMLPLFRQGHYAEGIIKGTETIGDIIASAAGVTLSNKTAQSASPSSEPTRKASSMETGFFVFVIILFICFFIWAVLKGKRGSGGRSGGSSGGGGASRGW